MSLSNFSLASISRPGKPKPPRIVLHGPHGIGKTTFAAQAPAPIFIRTEDGEGILTAPRFPLAQSFADVMAALKALEGEHAYKTVVVDTLDWLEPLIWSAVAFENGVSHIEDIGYGKGYTKSDEKWREFLDQLTRLRDERGLTTVCIAHTDIRRFDAPDSEPYDRYCLKMHKRASALVDEWADIIGFARHEIVTESTDVGFKKKVTRGVATGSRLLCLEERPAFDAKNRYGLSPEIPLAWASLKAELKAAFNPSKAPSNGAATEPTPEPANV